jgi:type II secretory pathway component PulF
MFYYMNSQSGYIKKKDFKDFLRIQRNYSAIVLILSVVIAWVLQIFVVSHVISLYQELGKELPFVTKNLFYIVVGMTVVIGLVSFGLLGGEINIDKYADKLAKYEDDEMVRVNEIMGIGMVPIIFVLLGLIIGLMVIAVISPIYSLTNTL